MKLSTSVHEGSITQPLEPGLPQIWLGQGLGGGLGLRMRGILGVLFTSKCGYFLPAIRPCLDALVQDVFRIAPNLYDRIVSDAGESQAYIVAMLRCS